MIKTVSIVLINTVIWNYANIRGVLPEIINNTWFYLYNRLIKQLGTFLLGVEPFSTSTNLEQECYIIIIAIHQETFFKNL